jgi:hypothetical protein
MLPMSAAAAAVLQQTPNAAFAADEFFRALPMGLLRDAPERRDIR